MLGDATEPPVDENEEIGEGGRTAAAIGVSQFGDV